MHLDYLIRWWEIKSKLQSDPMVCFLLYQKKKKTVPSWTSSGDITTNDSRNFFLHLSQKASQHLQFCLKTYSKKFFSNFSNHRRQAYFNGQATRGCYGLNIYCSQIPKLKLNANVIASTFGAFWRWLNHEVGDPMKGIVPVIKKAQMLPLPISPF